MLHHITDEGHMVWRCPGCQDAKTAHISHEEVQYPEGSDMVALPRCDCGTQTFLKVRHTEQELQPPRIYRDSQGKIIKVEFDGPTVYKMITHIEPDHNGKPISVCDDVVLHEAVSRHQELARQLETSGKGRKE